MTSILDELTALGVRLALDDFGTGYSSLCSLRRLPGATCSRSTARSSQSIDAGAERAAFVRAIVELADALSLSVVAEGIESARAGRRPAAARLRAGPGLPLRAPVGARRAGARARGRRGDASARGGRRGSARRLARRERSRVITASSRQTSDAGRVPPRQSPGGSEPTGGASPTRRQRSTRVVPTRSCARTRSRRRGCRRASASAAQPIAAADLLDRRLPGGACRRSRCRRPCRTARG